MMSGDSRSSTNLILILFGLLVAMSVVIGLVVLSEEAQPGHGFEHPQFGPGMQQGGPGDVRHAGIRWHALVFGWLQIAFFVVCLMLAVKRSRRAMVTFTVCGLLYAAAFTVMVVTDHFYAQGTIRSIVMGFPVPTAWMIYGMGGVPLLFVVLYVWKFNDWILSEEDMKRFDRLVEKQRKRQEPVE